MKTHLLIALILATLMFNIASCNFAPGSYPYAEKYKFNFDESKLIDAIEKFKKDNPDYCVPMSLQLMDGRTESRDDHWFHVYFYYKNENEILNTWVRQDEQGTTTFAFVSLNEGLELGNWKIINKDFSRKEDKIQKKKFEQRILDHIRTQLEKLNSEK